MNAHKHIPQPVTAVFNATVQPGKEADFQAAMHHLHLAAKTFPGHLGVTTVKSPTTTNNFITVLRFDSGDHMHNWLNSEARHGLMTELLKTATINTNTEKTGLETWFELPGRHTVQGPPRWKMVLTIFTGIYPLSLLFNLYVAAHLKHWPVALRSIVFAIVAPTLLTYVLMPFLTQKLFRRWLYPNS